VSITAPLIANAVCVLSIMAGTLFFVVAAQPKLRRFAATTVLSAGFTTGSIALRVSAADLHLC
jgi:hypothetical protein